MSKLEEDNDHGYFSMPHTPIFQEDDDFENEVQNGMDDLEDEDGEELDEDEDDFYEDDDDYDDFDDGDEE